MKSAGKENERKADATITYRLNDAEHDEYNDDDDDDGHV